MKGNLKRFEAKGNTSKMLRVILLNLTLLYQLLPSISTVKAGGGAGWSAPALQQPLSHPVDSTDTTSSLEREGRRITSFATCRGNLVCARSLPPLGVRQLRRQPAA